MIAQHDSWRLGFAALITALCKAKGVTSDLLSFESLSPTINLAYVKNNCWNLDDPTVTFWGPRKAKGKRSEAPPSSALPTFAPSTSTATPFAVASSLPALASAPVSSGPSTFSSETLFAILQSLHKGQIIIMQSSSQKQPVLSMEEFLSQVAWPGVRPSPLGGGEASAAQEPVLEEDEPIPPEPFFYETDPASAQEEVASPEPVPQSSPALVLDDP